MYILVPAVIIGIFYELFLFLDPEGSFILIYPTTPGTDLILGYFIFGSPAHILGSILTYTDIFFIGFGFLIKSIQSKGVIRKKYLFLSVGIFLFTSLPILEYSFLFILIIIRIGELCGIYFFYLGLKVEPEKTKKIPTKKDIKIEESIFRISTRPAQITEEEVSISKEKKICLVCKGKALKFVYVCSECEAFYCMSCAQAISNLENACWVCNAPIDESKPSKPYVKEEMEQLEIKKESKENIREDIK